MATPPDAGPDEPIPAAGASERTPAERAPDAQAEAEEAAKEELRAVQHPRAGLRVACRRLPADRTAHLRRARCPGRPLAGHDLARRGRDRGWNGPVALPDLVPIRYPLSPAAPVPHSPRVDRPARRRWSPTGSSAPEHRRPTADASRQPKCPEPTKEQPVSIVAAAPTDYTAPGVEEFWQPLFGTDGPFAITRPILLMVLATGLVAGS